MSKMGELYEEMREKNSWDEADRCADERRYKEHILKLDKRKERESSMNWKRHFSDKKTRLKNKGKSNSSFPRKGIEQKEKKVESEEKDA